MSKYVVLASLVANQFRRGQVIAAEQLGDRLQRSLDKGSVRPATEAEAKLESVDVSQPSPHASLEDKLAGIHRQLASYRERLANTERLLVEAQSIRDQLVKANQDLQARLAENSARMAELEKQQSEHEARKPGRSK